MKFRDLVYMRANSMGDNKQILIKVKLDVRTVFTRLATNDEV